MGPQGPVFWKWFEGIFLPRCPLGANTQVRSELHMLVTCLDELRQGRVLEVADILASRSRMLAYGLDKKNGKDDARRWAIANEFLTYTEETHSLVANATVEAACKILQKKAKRERTVGGGRSGR